MSESKLCVVLGGGGHARVVIDALQAAGLVEIRGILEADPSLWRTEVLGVPVLGGDELLPDLRKCGVTSFVMGVGSVKSNAHRRRVYETAMAGGLLPLTVVHPSAMCSRWTKLGPGAVVLAGAVVNAGAVLGTNVIVNSGAIVEHDCAIGDHVHIASGARLSGSVRLADGVFVGAGATVLQRVCIGANAVVGAGSVVLEDVPESVTVVGVPACRKS